MNTVSPLATGFVAPFDLNTSRQPEADRAAPAALRGDPADSVNLSMGAPDETTSRLMAEAFGSMQGANPLAAHQSLSAERVMRLVGLLE